MKDRLICDRCGLEAKKLYKVKIKNKYLRYMDKVDWVSFSLHVLIIIFIAVGAVTVFVGSEPKSRDKEEALRFLSQEH